MGNGWLWRKMQTSECYCQTGGGIIRVALPPGHPSSHLSFLRFLAHKSVLLCAYVLHSLAEQFAVVTHLVLYILTLTNPLACREAELGKVVAHAVANSGVQMPVLGDCSIGRKMKNTACF